MCRFLMVKSKNPIKLGKLLTEFAEACRKSRTPDGDWQGDGWGISYLSYNSQWIVKKSLHPIWEEKNVFKSIPKSRYLLVHARSSSFPNQRNKIEYNQPFVFGKYSFVFNGLIRGVSLPIKIKGEIGSQKIWNLLLGLLEDNSPKKSLILLKDKILKNSKIVHALNIGICDMENLYAFCFYNFEPDYYSLHYFSSQSLFIISSEPLSGLKFKKMRAEELIVL